LNQKRTHAAWCLAALLAVSLVVAGPVSAAPFTGKDLTLDQAITLALERNLGLLGSNLTAQVAESATRQAVDKLAPKVTVGGSFDRHLADKAEGPEATVTVNQNYPGLWPTLTLPGYPRPLGSTALAQLGADQARRRVDKARSDLVFNVIQAYYGLLKAGRLKEVQAAALAASVAARRDTEAKVNAGAATRVDLLRAEMEVANAELAVAKAGNAYTAAETVLFSLLQSDRPAGPVRYAPVPAAAATAGTLETLTVQALAKRPDVADAALSLDRAVSQQNLAQLETLPALSLTGSHTGDKYSLSSSWDPIGGGVNWTATASTKSLATSVSGRSVAAGDDWNVGVSVSYPLHDAGALREAALQAKLGVAQAQASLDQVKSGVASDVQSAWFELSEARLSVGAAQKAVGQSAEALRLTRLRVENGIGTPAELLDANAQDLQVQVNLVQAEYAEQVAVAKVKKAVGLL
jgi:outer membrane protein TolC